MKRRNLLRTALALAIFAPMIFGGHGKTLIESRETPLAHFDGVNGLELLEMVDEFVELNSTPTESFNFLERKREEDKPAAALQELLNNTVMTFGATTDGIGIGTAFSVRKIGSDSAIFATAFHVLERFCEIPESTLRDQVAIESETYPCRSLFALHDIAIDTRENRVTHDGEQPWKSPIGAVFFFDKRLDLALFRISLPTVNNITQSMPAVEFDARKPKFAPLSAKVGPYETSLSAPDLAPLDAFEARMIAYSAAYKTESSGSVDQPSLIKKRWFNGQYLMSKTYENDKKLGFVTALLHSIKALPGTSGGPIALTDGRVFGINTSLLENRYIISEACASKAVSDKEFYAIPTSYLKEVKL